MNEFHSTLSLLVIEVLWTRKFALLCIVLLAHAMLAVAQFFVKLLRRDVHYCWQYSFVALIRSFYILWKHVRQNQKMSLRSRRFFQLRNGEFSIVLLLACHNEMAEDIKGRQLCILVWDVPAYAFWVACCTPCRTFQASQACAKYLLFFNVGLYEYVRPRSFGISYCRDSDWLF